MYHSLFERKVRRLLVFLKPVEVLDVLPEVGLVVLVLLLLVAQPVGIVEGVGAEDHAVAILDDGLAGDEDVEPAVEGVVDAQLVAVELEPAIRAVVHENRRLGDCASDDAASQVLQEDYLGLDQDVDFRVRTADYFVGFSLNTLLHHYLLPDFVLQTRYLNTAVAHALELLRLLRILHSEVLVSPRELELLLRLQLLLQFQQVAMRLFEQFLVVLSIVCGKDVVNLEVIGLHRGIMGEQLGQGLLPFFERGC